jgi:hypothetical protein
MKLELSGDVGETTIELGLIRSEIKVVAKG